MQFKIVTLDQATKFMELESSMLPEHFGQWVVIADEKILGYFSTIQEADIAASEQGFDIFNRYVHLVGYEHEGIIAGTIIGGWIPKQEYTYLLKGEI